jgi:hypothetical protein
MKNEYNGIPVVRYEVRTFEQRHAPGHWIQLPGTPICHSQEEAKHYMDLVKLGRFRFPRKTDEVPAGKQEFHPADGLYRIIKVTTQYEITYTTEESHNV